MGLVGLALGGATVAPLLAQTPRPGRFSFVVVGHIRGNTDDELHPRLDELLDRIRVLKPAMVFLTGDLIWGSLPASLADRSRVAAQWDRLDAKLAILGVPVYRVPGNHDIHDPVTRDVFFERYGPLPKAVEHGNTRVFLFNTTFTPAGNDPVPIRMKLGKTVRLDSAQVGFLTRELERRRFEHEFVVMHHLLWWEDDAPWWTEVAPTLVKHGVQGVFSGDLGPTMYTHLQRDGIDYFRNILNADVDRSIAGKPDASERIVPSLQFETMLQVIVDGPTVEYRVEPIGTLTSGAFAPSRWKDGYGWLRMPGRYYDPAILPKVLNVGPQGKGGGGDEDEGGGGPAKGGATRRSGGSGMVGRFVEAFGSPLRLAVLAGMGVLGFGVGVLVRRRR